MKIEIQNQENHISNSFYLLSTMPVTTTPFNALFQGLVFRRTSWNYVQLDGDVKVTRHSFDGSSEAVPLDEVDSLSKKDLQERIEFTCQHFSGTSKLSKLVHTDVYDRPIFYSSSRYAEPSFEGGHFTLTPTTTRTPPRDNDLICGVVNVSDKGPSFKWWFIASQQFYNLWKITMQPDHPDFSKFANVWDEYLLRGAKLATCNYRKWELDYEEAGVEFTPKDRNRVFRLLRCEKMARDPANIHLYPLMAVMTVLREWPSETNIPKNHAPGYPNSTKWRIPTGCAETFAANLGLTRLRCVMCNDNMTCEKVCDACMCSVAGDNVGGLLVSEYVDESNVFGRFGQFTFVKNTLPPMPAHDVIWTRRVPSPIGTAVPLDGSLW